MVIDIVRLLQAYGQPTLVLANIFYTEVTTPLSVLKTGVYVAITVISDAFMVGYFLSLIIVVFISVLIPALSHICSVEQVTAHLNYPNVIVPVRYRYEKGQKNVACFSNRRSKPLGTGVAAVVSLGTLKAQSFFIQRQARITEAFFATTLTLNGLCTGK